MARHHRVLIHEEDSEVIGDALYSYLRVDSSCDDHEPTNTDLLNARELFISNIRNGTLVGGELNFEGDNGAGVYLYFTVVLHVKGGLSPVRRDEITVWYKAAYGGG